MRLIGFVEAGNGPVRYGRIKKLLHAVHVNSKSRGYGLLLVKELVEKVNGVLAIVSSEEEDTLKMVTLQ